MHAVRWQAERSAGRTHSIGVPPPAAGHAPPRVLLVSQIFPPAVGGSGNLLESVYSRLDGVDVHVLTDAGSSPGADGRQGRLQVRRGRIDGRHWGLLHPRGTASHLALARTIWRVAGRGRAIVHCGRALPEGLAASLASAGPRGPKFVFWAHGEEITTALTSRDYTFSMRHVFRAAAAAIANSRHTARVLESAGMPGEKVRVVHPGVDATRFSPRVDGRTIRQRFAPDGEMLMLSVGRCQKRKGLDLAIRALATLAARRPQVRHLIVGDGEERQALEALAVQLGIRSRVAFAGEVSAADLPRYFAACDLFVLPNRVEAHDFEGFGLVFLEAAAAGLPVIGGATGGVREAVEDGVNGLLVGGTDVLELAAAIEQLVASEPLRRRMGTAGRARALSTFTWERAAADVGAIHAAIAAAP